jgi:hypothetical protein
MSGQSKVNHPVTISLAGRILLAGFCVLFGTAAQAAVQCTSTITANVVVLDNPTVFNRLGAQNPNWITYALRRDVVVAPNVGNAVNVDVIAEPAVGGNLLADTTAAGDDVQVVDVGDAVAPGDVIIEPGPNGVLDTLAAVDDVVAALAIGEDVVLSQVPDGQLGAFAGQVELRPDKRTRPLVVRSVAGSCLTVNFTNLLDPMANPNDVQQGPPQGQPGALFNDDQVAGRCAGFHATGTELVSSTLDDGSFVGQNQAGDDVAANCGAGDQKGSLVGPGGNITYNLYTPHEGAFTINSYGATLGSEASSGNTAVGMFGALNVEPVGSRIYRSQVTEEELRLATTGTVPTDCVGGDIVGIDCNPGGQPIIDYEKLYPNVQPWIAEGKAGLPVLNMICNADAVTAEACVAGELVHSDINAIIAGPDPDGTWKLQCPGENCPYPLENAGKNNPTLPNRLEPSRTSS